METRVYQQLDTGLHADSVEWCRHSKSGNVLACGRYQLNEETRERTGGVLLYVLKRDQDRWSQYIDQCYNCILLIYKLLSLLVICRWKLLLVGQAPQYPVVCWIWSGISGVSWQQVVHVCVCVLIWTAFQRRSTEGDGPQPALVSACSDGSVRSLQLSHEEVDAIVNSEQPLNITERGSLVRRFICPKVH